MNYLTMDTETADLNGDVYDFAYVVHDRKGEIITQYNALVLESFTNPKQMMGAFYAKKTFTHYAPMLSDGRVKLVAWDEIVKQFQSDILAHDVKVVAAYNLGFDLRALRTTNKKLGTAKTMLPRPVDLIDIWQFACEVVLNKKTYKKIAIENGWVSKAGNIRTSAEMAYRFCAGDFGFIEDHTALSDALIEVKILAKCLSRKKKIPYGVYNNSPWKIVNEK